LEELIYWGIIFLFYLFSAYRSRQKKVEAKEFQVPEPLSEAENKNSKTDLNIFEFLDEAMEKSAVVLDDSLTTNFVESSNDELLIQQNSKKSIQTDYPVEDDLNKSFNIKDKHLNHLKSRIITKETSSHSEQKLLTLQQKLKNKPTKLAIVMQAIFDPPKSQGI
jgi:cbb3-type cytochrome oxidase subunit 3